MNYENRKYLIIPTTLTGSIDFNQVCETSSETLRKSVDETKTFIKWDNDTPDFVNSLQNTEGPYTHEEIIQILQSEEWSSPLTGSTE